MYRLGVVSEHRDLATAHNTGYNAHRRRASGRVVGGEAPELDIVLWKKNVYIFVVQTKRVEIDRRNKLDADGSSILQTSPPLRKDVHAAD